MNYIVAIGSNIRPSKHVPWVMRQMSISFDEVKAGRFFKTEAYSMDSMKPFWNGAVGIKTPLNSTALKEVLTSWELKSGRDKQHPQCSKRNRTLDLDIVWSEHEGWHGDIKEIQFLPYLWSPVSSLLSTRYFRVRKGYPPAWFKVSGKLIGIRKVRLVA